MVIHHNSDMKVETYGKRSVEAVVLTVVVGRKQEKTILRSIGMMSLRSVNQKESL
jgi:radical SAM superfamily enzyme with C-terminal helix-hairpin-helix motif